MIKQLTLILAIFLLPLSLYAKDPITAKVERVIDGDTIVLESGEKVRLIGIDCPELHNPKRNERNAKKLGIDPDNFQEYGNLARERLDSLIIGDNTVKGRVRLEFDPVNKKIEHRDKYGRLLAYVYAEPFVLEGLRNVYDDFLNRFLVKEGFCPVYRRFNFSEKEKFIELEKEAKEKGRGIWGLR